MITTEAVKELRDRTGVSVMQCKKALEEAGGDMEKALIILKKRSSGIAEKKAGRELNAGVVASYVHASKKIAALVELRSETDFVSKNEEFGALAREIAMQVAATNPAYLNVSEIPEEARAKAKETFEAEVKGKPEEMKEKILEGKLASYFKDQVLLEQEYIRDPGQTIQGLVEGAVQKFGERIEIARFTRFSV